MRPRVAAVGALTCAPATWVNASAPLAAVACAILGSRAPAPPARSPTQFDGASCKWNCLNYTQIPPSQRNCAAGTAWWVGPGERTALGCQLAASAGRPPPACHDLFGLPVCSVRGYASDQCAGYSKYRPFPNNKPCSVSAQPAQAPPPGFASRAPMAGIAASCHGPQPSGRSQVAGETGECDTDGRCYLGPSWFSVIKEIRNQMDTSFVSNSGAAAAAWDARERSCADDVTCLVLALLPASSPTDNPALPLPSPAAPAVLANLQGGNAVTYDEVTDMRSLIAFAKGGERPRCGMGQCQ